MEWISPYYSISFTSLLTSLVAVCFSLILQNLDPDGIYELQMQMYTKIIQYILMH